jgi:hypothetical protein
VLGFEPIFGKQYLSSTVLSSLLLDKPAGIVDINTIFFDKHSNDISSGISHQVIIFYFSGYSKYIIGLNASVYGFPLP